MNIVRGCVAACLAAFAIAAVARPVEPVPFSAVVDGEEIVMTPVGDEYGCYYVANDGRKLVKKDGVYRYVTEVELKKALERGAKRRELMFHDVKESRVTNEYNMFKMNIATCPSLGDVKIPVILCAYKDVPFWKDDASTRKYFDGLFNKEGFDENGSNGCAREWFIAASNGAFRPQFDVYGPVTLPQNRAYYGKNVGINGDDDLPEDMVIHAADILKDEIDFTQYDNDGDGRVDNVLIVYAGISEDKGLDSAIWPHFFLIHSAKNPNNDRTNPYRNGYQVGDVYLDGYTVINEMYGNTRYENIGAFVHELSHTLGLPDLYNGQAVYTPKEYDVMDIGMYNNNGATPPTHSSVSRFALNWLDAEKIENAANLELENLQDSNKAYMVATDMVGEFYLFENRQQKGWDTYLPGHGMIVWHVDYDRNVWNQNRVSASSSHCYIDLVESTGTYATSYFGRNQYPFPGPQGITSFTDDTTPAMRTWNGLGLNCPITEITETEDGKIQFKVRGGSAEQPGESTGGIESVENIGSIAISGKRVSADADSHIIVYDMLGGVAAEGYGAVEVATSGVYAVKINDRIIKVALK